MPVSPPPRRHALRACPLFFIAAFASLGHARESQGLSWPDRSEVLTLPDLVGHVLADNPDLEAARHTWRASRQKRAQVSDLPDPVVGYSVAPQSVASEDSRFGHVLRLQQRFTSKRKLSLRARVADTGAEAELQNLRSARIRLAVLATRLFAEAYTIERSLEINREHAELLTDLKESAVSQYSVGRGSQQDPLQAELEVAHLDHQNIVLASRLAEVHARMNGLMHRAPTAPLPPTPRVLPLPEVHAGGSTASPNETRSSAQHPDLRAFAARLRGKEAEISLAHAASRPDFTAGAAYNWLWNQSEHRFTVGLSWNLPIRRRSRRAALRAAEAQLAATRARQTQREDELGVAVETARIRLREIHHVIELLETRLLPLAQDQIAAAQAGFETGRNSFLTLIVAEKNIRRFQLELHQARAETLRRRADLEASLGKIPGYLAKEVEQ